jgi:hypothetical protein
MPRAISILVVMGLAVEIAATASAQAELRRMPPAEEPPDEVRA